LVGLRGRVRAERLRRLLTGRHAITGRPLLPPGWAVGWPCPCRRPHPPWWERRAGVQGLNGGRSSRCPRAAVESPRHDGRPCCCDWPTWA
jgi:hypothetical protein